jgi:hypothetical protein
MKATFELAVLDPAELYERDFYAWTRQQARELRRLRRLRPNAPLDLAHLAEEIEDLGRSESRELGSRLFRLLTHLLKWRYQPKRRTRSSRATIGERRRELARLLRRSPSLRRELAAAWLEAYVDARGQAADETGLPLTTFPEICPLTLDQALDPAFWPDRAD